MNIQHHMPFRCLFHEFFAQTCLTLFQESCFSFSRSGGLIVCSPNTGGFSKLWGSAVSGGCVRLLGLSSFTASWWIFWRTCLIFPTMLMKISGIYIQLNLMYHTHKQSYRCSPVSTACNVIKSTTQLPEVILVSFQIKQHISFLGVYD